jgi:hypothetical protein
MYIEIYNTRSTHLVGNILEHIALKYPAPSSSYSEPTRISEAAVVLQL